MTKSPPEDLMQHHGHLVRRAMQVLNALWDEEVSDTITSQQFAALNALYREPNLDQRTLGRRISDSSRSTGKSLTTVSTTTATSSICRSRRCSITNSPTSRYRRTISSTCDGYRFTPRTVNMSSTRPWIPPTSFRNGLPHEHGSRDTTTRSPVR